MNTSIQINKAADLAGRLERLAAADPVVAEQIRLALAAPQDPVPAALDPSAAVAEWLQEPRPADQAGLVIAIGSLDAAELAQILRALPEKSGLLYLEPSPARAADLFLALDLESAVAAGRLFLAIGEDEELIRRQFYRAYRPQEINDLRLLDSGRALPAAYSFYQAVLQQIRKDVRLETFNAGTLVCRGPLWQFNTLKNLQAITGHPGVRRLKDLFPGRPALVVGAGPSLDAALPMIKAVADQFVVIATGTALRPLRNAGIRPALVVAVDGSHRIGPQFETRCDDLFLACSSLVFSSITGKFRGLFTGGLLANPIDAWLDSRLDEPRGWMYAGGTVTASAMALAVEMGCAPVLVVGLDLSFRDDGTTHAGQTMYDQHRLNPNLLIRVPGNFQREVLTTEQFRCYIHHVESFVKEQERTTFYNVTRGGAHIAGMPVVDPDAISAWGTGPLAAYERVAAAHAAFAPGAAAPLRAELDQVSTQLGDVLAASRSAAMVCNRLILALQRPEYAVPETVAAALEEYRRLDQLIDAAQSSSTFLKMSLWPAAYELQGRQASSGDPQRDQVQVFRRLRQFNEQVAGAARWTRDLLARVAGEWDGAAVVEVTNPAAVPAENAAPAAAVV